MLFEDLQNVMPEIAERLVPGEYLEDASSISAYYLSKTKKWAYRVWLPIYRAFGEGKAAPHSKIRAAKFYDSTGRLNRTAYSRLLKAMNQNRLPKNRLDRFLGDTVIQHKGLEKE